MTQHRPTVVHLVRHGEVHNPDAVLYGRLPGYHLSDRGRRMAQAVADYFAESALTHLATSPLERAQESMAPIADRHPELAVRIDPGLVEAENLFTGQVFGPRHLALRDPRNWRLLLNPLRPSWGEPYTEVADRMLAAIARAADAAGQGGEAVLVSHQLPIVIARRAAQGRRLPHDPRGRQCTLASITTFEVDGTGIRWSGYTEPAIGLVPVGDRRKNISAGR